MEKKRTGNGASPERQYIVGIDIGGTFTDAFVSAADGRHSWTGKSLTTYDDLSRGLVGALEAAAQDIGIPVTELLARTVKFAHGTTVVTNVIAEMRGAKVGLLTTQGCGDLLTIARSARAYEFDFLKHAPLPAIVDSRCIVEVSERIDCKGQVLAPLNEEGLRVSIQRLVEEEKIEAVAICFLWSFLHPQHERRVRDIVKDMYPDLFVSISSEIHPVMREYERLMTTILNSYAGNVFAKYVERVESVLRELGLKTKLLMMSSSGGSLSAQEAAQRPIALAYSGPAGGLLGATTVAKNLGLSKLLNTDMGGTSFDVSLLVDGKPLTRNKAKIGPFWTGLSVLDIEAIGAGGGSLAWVDGRGMVQVGPQSAGSTPGPACYGKGGVKPAISDAAVVLGILDPEYFLGGKIKLSRSSAEQALVQEVGQHIGLDARDTAAGIFNVVTANMANAVRHATIGRGLDPREFTMLSYGGCGPMFAASIAHELGIRQVVIPEVSAVFSAYGVARTDIRRERYRTLRQPIPLSVSAVNTVFAELDTEVRADLQRDNVAAADMELHFEADLQYAGQVSPFNVPLSVPPFSDADIGSFRVRFETEYERLMGEGTAVASVPVELINCRVVGYGRIVQPPTVEFDRHHGTASTNCARSAERRVYLPTEKREAMLPVINVADMRSDSQLQGPALIERDDTTIFVPARTAARMDSHHNIVLDLN